MSDWWSADPVAPPAASSGSWWHADPIAPPAQPSVAGDIAKSGGIGVAKGTIGLAGLGGDINSLISAAGHKAGDALGLSPTTQNAIGSGFNTFKNIAGPAALNSSAPTSQQIQSAIESRTGQFYQPQTMAGRYAQTAGEFLPAAIGGPETLGARLLKMVAAPAIASQTASELSAGTAAEPYARIGGAILGGAGAARALAPTVAKLAPSDIISAGSAAYKSPIVQAVQIKPQAAERVSDAIATELNQARLNERLAPQTHAIIDNLATPVQNNYHTIEDFQTTRQLLEKQAGNFANPTEQAAASKAITALDKQLAGMPQSDLISGDISQANATLSAGRADYAAGMAAQRVQGKLNDAEI